MASAPSHATRAARATGAYSGGYPSTYAASKPDLIHATLTHANVAARVVGRRRRIPVLTSTATIEVERRWHPWLEWLTARRDAGHIVNTPALARHVMQSFGVPLERVHIIPPAIEPPASAIERAAARRQLGLPEDTPVIAWVGRLDPVKRVDWLVRCVEELHERRVVVAMAGDGPLRAALEHDINASPARERVHLLGWQQDLTPLLSAADLFCLPSRTEGLPNAVLEAMAFGVPVVAHQSAHAARHQRQRHANAAGRRRRRTHLRRRRSRTAGFARGARVAGLERTRVDR